MLEARMCTNVKEHAQQNSLRYGHHAITKVMKSFICQTDSKVKGMRAHM